MSVRFDLVIFDLDGTLLDTLADIAGAGNHVLRTFGLPPRPVADYRILAGQGARWLVERALGDKHTARVDEGVALLKAWQLEHGLDQTRPYEGIAELLDGLMERGVPMAILSNKPHAATLIAVGERLRRWKFAAVQGAEDGVLLKPDPAGALAITAKIGVEPERVMYIGDTRADMETANRAGMYAVGVLWGFRDENELRDAGAKVIVERPGEVMELVEEAK